MITIKIDVTKVDKAKLFPGKNGAKYLDLVLLETPNDQYGNDFMVKQGQTKEERASGVRTPILGNAKIFNKPSGAAPDTTQRADNPPPTGDSGVPF